MIDRCYDVAEAAHRQGQPLIGILCEFTPREILLAAGALPICLCGGSAATIPAAEEDLPANLCPLIKSTYGYAKLGTNPFLEWADLVVAETTCDGKKKMLELLGASKPMFVLELPQRSEDAASLQHWIDELRRLCRFLADRYGIPLGPEGLRDAIRTMNRERSLRRQLADLMTSDVPPMTGRQLLGFKSILSGQEADFEQYERALQLYGSGAGAAAPGSPRADGRRRVRVLLTGVPVVHGAERVVELIEDVGGLVVAMENCTGLKPILEDVDPLAPDPLEAIAQKYYHLPCSVMTPNPRRLDMLRELHQRFRPECVIELVWQACLTYDIEAAHVRRLVEQEFRLPYLKIVTDYSPADSARISTRIEALFETVQDGPGS